MVINYFKVFLSSGIAFFIAILVALLIEKLGGALGSIIGTVPTTLIPAAYLIMTEASSSEQEKVDSTLALVFGILATDIMFMPTWKILPPRLPKNWRNGYKVIVTTVVGLVLWFICAVTTILVQSVLKEKGVSMWAISVTIVLFCAVFGACLCWNLPPTPAGKNKVKWYTHLYRGIAAFCALFICGIMSQMGLGVAAGAMGTFPALFLTAMVSVSLSQSAEVATGAIGPLIMGSISGASFALCCGFCYDILKVSAGWCCFYGFLFAVCCWSIPVYFFLKWRRDTTAMKKLRVVDKSEAEAKVEVELKENPDGTVLNNEETEEITYDEPVENEITLEEKENNTIKLELFVCLTLISHFNVSFVSREST